MTSWEETIRWIPLNKGPVKECFDTFVIVNINKLLNEE